jgi:hypothetical protein
MPESKRSLDRKAKEMYIQEDSITHFPDIGGRSRSTLEIKMAPMKKSRSDIEKAKLVSTEK